MPTDSRETVEQALATFVEAFNDLDHARMAACFLDDAPVFFPWGGHREVGFWAEQFEAFQIQRLGDTVAVVTFHLEHDPETLGRRTIVLSRTAEGWKIAHLHASTFPRETSAGT